MDDNESQFHTVLMGELRSLCSALDKHKFLSCITFHIRTDKCINGTKVWRYCLFYWCHKTADTGFGKAKYDRFVNIGDIVFNKNNCSNTTLCAVGRYHRQEILPYDEYMMFLTHYSRYCLNIAYKDIP